MATFTKVFPAPVPEEFNSYFVREAEEAATQTFTLGQFLIWSSGYIAVQADPLALGTAIGFAVRAGQNGASAGDKISEFISLRPGFLFFANFLTTAGATTTIAATDLGTQTDLADDAVHADGSSVITYASDETGTPTAEMVSLKSDEVIPNDASRAGVAVAGDSDARVMFKIVDTALSTSS